MSITLTPVLELEPSSYKNPEREYIFSDFILAREQFWRDCLQDSEITGLNPYHIGSWFVKLSDIDVKNINIIILNFLSRYSSEKIKELNFSSLPGGYVFQSKSIVIFPNCCGKVEDIFEWEIAAHSANREKGYLGSVILH